MKTKNYIVILGLIALLTSPCFSQDRTERDESLDKTKDALKLIDKGDFDKALSKVRDALDFDSTNIYARYTLGLVYYHMKKYDRTISILENLLAWREAYENVYVLLGNAYYLNGNPEKAVQTYNNGVSKFPYSGSLYNELGTTNQMEGNIPGALEQFEFGIRFEPDYPTNYYDASKILLDHHDLIWGIIYGEIFLNLTSVDERYNEMSNLLYNAYKNMVVKKDSVTTVYVEVSKDTASNTFESSYSAVNLLSCLSVIKEKFGISTIIEMRNTFLQLWEEKAYTSEFPNVLIDYHRMLIDAGYFEIYNYKIFGKADKQQMKMFIDSHKSLSDKYEIWRKTNPLKMTRENGVYRGVYVR